MDPGQTRPRARPSMALAAGEAMRVARGERLLSVRFAEPQRMLSWAIHNGGAHTGDTVAWVFVQNAELPPGRDPRQLLRARLGAADLADAVGLMTSRHLRHAVEARAARAGERAACVATVGLGNALRVGDPPGLASSAGTINLLCWCSLPLDACATLEALSIAVEARTAALAQLGVPSSRSGAGATGTGTDCVVIASPHRAGGAQAHAGKHTLAGHLVGAAVLEAVTRGARAWVRERAAAEAAGDSDA